MNNIAGGFFLLATVFGFLSCSESPVKVTIEAPDFKVLEAAPGGRESWLDNPQTFAEEKGFEAKENYFYVGESKSPDKRLACEKAHANIADDISKQVAIFTDTSIARAATESAQSDSNQITSAGQVSEETTRVSSQLSKAQISNVITKKTYWERRDYSEAGGAKNLTVCWVLAYVGKKNINAMVSRATNIKLSQDLELKSKVEKKLENIDEKYEAWQKTH